MEAIFFKDSKEFGKFLKSIREDANLTIRKLDSLSGVSHSYISQLERGERGIPSPEILNKLAKPLGIPYERLMQYAGYIDSSPFDEGINYEEDPKRDYKRILARTKKWLVKNNELVPIAKKNIDFFLETNNVTSLTSDNIIQKLEEYIELEPTTNNDVYNEIFEILRELALARQFSNKNLDAIIKYSQALTYNDHLVTDNDRKVILNFLDVLFSNRDND